MAPKASDEVVSVIEAWKGRLMTAPALVILAPGSRDPQVARVAHELRDELIAVRPSMIVRAAFLGTACSPTGTQIVAQLSRQGVKEVVFVPLLLSHDADHSPVIEELLLKAQAAFPAVRFAVSRPIGPEASLLTILDQRTRDALCLNHCLELDALVLSAEHLGDVRGETMLARRARQWSAHHRLPCLPAVADDTGPSVANAITSLRSQGRRHIAVGSFFLTADEPYHVQADLAHRYGAISVSDPIGCAPEVLELILARYAFAAMNLLDLGIEALDEPEGPDLELVGA